MTQEEKQLLLKDLCARLPHQVRCKVWLKDGTTEEGPLDLEHNYADVLLDAFYYNKIKNIKSYLRPMSSMTEEEYEEFCKTDKLMATLLEINKLGIQGTRECHLMVAKALGERVAEQQNWLNSHHFDYRGLIEKGLALEAPEGMYVIK